MFSKFLTWDFLIIWESNKTCFLCGTPSLPKSVHSKVNIHIFHCGGKNMFLTSGQAQLWECLVVSDIKKLAADPLGPVGWRLGPLGMRLVRAHLTASHRTGIWGYFGLFVMLHELVLSSFCVESCYGRPPPPGSTVPTGLCPWAGHACTLRDVCRQPNLMTASKTAAMSHSAKPCTIATFIPFIFNLLASPCS